jgi:hypothetical protein
MTERSPFMYEGSRGVLGRTLLGIGHIAELGFGITKTAVTGVPELFKAGEGLLRRHPQTPISMASNPVIDQQIFR